MFDETRGYPLGSLHWCFPCGYLVEIGTTIFGDLTKNEWHIPSRSLSHSYGNHGLFTSMKATDFGHGFHVELPLCRCGKATTCRSSSLGPQVFLNCLLSGNPSCVAENSLQVFK